MEDRLGRLEKEVAGLRKSRPAAETAVTLPMFLTLIAVVGGSYYLLSERMTETTMQLNMRIDDTNNLIKIVKSDLEKDIKEVKTSLEGDIAKIDAKLDRLLLR